MGGLYYVNYCKNIMINTMVIKDRFVSSSFVILIGFVAKIRILVILRYILLASGIYRYYVFAENDGNRNGDGCNNDYF